jgi:hypothetical protein
VLAVVNAGAIFVLNGKPAAGVLTLLDALLTPFFLGDFVLRVIGAQSKLWYFFLQFGWADLLGSVWRPGFDGLRLLRLCRIVRRSSRARPAGAPNTRAWRTLSNLPMPRPPFHYASFDMVYGFGSAKHRPVPR